MEKNQETIFIKLKDTMRALETFLHSSKKLALNLRKSLTPSSKPTFVDQDGLSKLKLKLEAIRVTLSKADMLSMKDSQNQLWMRELRDIECWAEDVVEEIQFESLRATKLEEFKRELLLSRKVKGKRKRGEDRDISALFSLQSESLCFKIRRIADRYREIAMHRKALYLREEDGFKICNPCPLPPSCSFPKCELFGRGNDMKTITELLLSDTENEFVYSIIPIVGMAGVGKTAVVQHLFQNEIIKSGFDLMIWVSLSQKFDLVEVIRKILEVVTMSQCALSELESLNREVIGHIKGKKFLLVLDNMWDENHENWQSLSVLFHHGAKGSKVLVTTRSIKVGKMMCLKSYHLSCLSDDFCWLVCKKSACHGGSLNLCPNLIEIGKRIVTKCKGLPLAAEAVGSLLSSSHCEKHWGNVLDNHLWLDDGVANQVLSALVVSYEFLPLHLKRCFAYCSLFQKGHVFEKYRIVQLWIAQGFIPPNAGTKCFDDLVDRYFFQHSPYHYRTEGMYVVHDLYHELAQYVSCKEYYRMEDCKLQMIDERVRHSSLVSHDEKNNEVVQLGSFNGQNLRSLLILGRKEKLESMQAKVPFCIKIPGDIFRHLECLRALDLRNTDICELPNSIGKLIHLRYLSLENTRISCLPESIGGFFNLLSVNLKGCYSLKELPKATKLLDNLMNFELPLAGNCDIWMPSGIGQLTNLQNLSLFVVGSENDSCQLNELGSLINLKNKLHVSHLNNVWDPNFAKEANLQKKEKLVKITLEWHMIGSSSIILNEKIPSEVLEKLQPNSNLEELHINGFPGDQFPSWLGDKSLLKLVSLEIINCENAYKLPSLGNLPSLKHLSIQSMARLQYIGAEFNKGFPVLECLVLKKMDLWEKWDGVESGDFPCLKYLTLNNCGKLRALPMFSPLVRIKVKKCPCLNVSMSTTILAYQECISLV